MKIVSKAYLLIAILISAAAFNLFLLYQDDQAEVSSSYSIIRAGEVKVKAEVISASASAVASGDFIERDVLENEIETVDTIMKIIKEGGIYNNQSHQKIPSDLMPEYEKISLTCLPSMIFFSISSR